MALFQNSRDLCCYSSIEACHDLHVVSFPTADTSVIRVCRVTCWQGGPELLQTLSCLAPLPELAAFRVTWGNRLEHYLSSVEYVA